MEQFDSAASDYDLIFTDSCVGKAQRSQVWRYVDRYVTPNAKNILEINCGTGEDAKIWSERKKNIVATDISPEMIQIAQKKAPEIQCEILDVTKLNTTKGHFDTVFSNFGGLNCLPTEELEKFFSDAGEILDSGNHMVLVIMGKKCLWDQFYMIFKRRLKDRNRRNTDQPVDVNVEGENVPTWYYSPDQIEELAEAKFDTITIRPIGLFVPPSYLAPAFEKRKGLFSFVKWLDRQFTHKKFSNLADHFLIVLKRK